MSSHPYPSQHGYNYHGGKNPNATALEITKGLLNFAFVLVTCITVVRNIARDNIIANYNTPQNSHF